MLHIGIDIRPLMSPIRAGVGEYVYKFLDAIFKIDKENQYFLYYNSYTDVSTHIPKWQQENVRYIHTKWPNKLYNVLIKCFGIPKIGGPHLDYFFSPNFNFTSLPKNTKSVLTVHDLSFEFFPEFFSYKQRLWHRAINTKKQCQKADIILVPSENTKRDIIDVYKISPKKIKVISPGVNFHNSQTPTVIPTEAEESLRPEAKGSTPRGISDLHSSEDSVEMTKQIKQRYNLTDKFILFLGTIEPRKNIIGLIKAFEQYRSLASPKQGEVGYSLVIAGHKGWNDKEIFKAAQKSTAKDKIKFIGSVAEEDKHILYSLSSLFVYPSFYEGFGFPVVEAMACGVPVIASNRSSLPEITGQAAYLVNPNRPSELAAAMNKILADEKLKEYFKNTGLAQAKKFNWENTAKLWTDIII